MKRPTEAEVGRALAQVDLAGLVIHKPSDADFNWKPCDYFVWWRGGAAWVEVKDVAAVNLFSLRELRPAQLQGVRDATAAGIPYWLCVWWRRHELWTISDLGKALTDASMPTSISRDWLQTRYGVSSTKKQLSSTLKTALLGEVG